MKRILPFDEINALAKRIKRYFNADGRIASQSAADSIIDELLDLFLLAYANGIREVNEQFGTNIEPTAAEIAQIVFKRIDGATWRDRVLTWYMVGGDIADILRIAETETTRIGNEAALGAAVQAGATTKTWLTMLDDRVRDTHSYIEGVTVPIDAWFYTYDGDSALAPGGFSSVENNANCRCELRFN